MAGAISGTATPSVGADAFRPSRDNLIYRRHVRHCRVGTLHGSQGATADRSMTHLESFRAQTVDAKSAYVAISRARKEAIAYTDSREKLAGAIESRSGERATVLDRTRQIGTKSGGMSLGDG